MHIKKPILFLLFLLFFLFGAFISYFIIAQLTPKNEEPPFIEKRESGYYYINPLLECEVSQNIGDTELKDLKEKVENLLLDYQDIEVGLYYRDLTNGPWFGINEDKTFSPQSLLKLPIALSYFKIAENNPELLENTILYETESENKNLEENLEVGKNYKINYLLERMLITSDNVSFGLLTKRLPKKNIQQVHSDLSIAYPSSSTPDDFITVKSYASIFRVLYNSSYLSRIYSETILSLLTESAYTDGLTGGVPEQIEVAHKYGVLNNTANKNSQLHDCGIIYEPSKPYILCVMSKGKDQEKLTLVIQEVSKLVYEEVSQKN